MLDTTVIESEVVNLRYLALELTEQSAAIAKLAREIEFGTILDSRSELYRVNYLRAVIRAYRDLEAHRFRPITGDIDSCLKNMEHIELKD